MKVTTDYTTCSCCGSEGTLKPWGKVLRCSVCQTMSEPAPSSEQIEEAKLAARREWQRKAK